MRTISAHTEIDRLFATGRRVSHPALLVLACPTVESPGTSGRVLFVAGKRLGTAVVRNRCKRVMREAFRRAHGPFPGWDIALIARRGTAQASGESLDRALDEALVSMGIRR